MLRDGSFERLCNFSSQALNPLAMFNLVTSSLRRLLARMTADDFECYDIYGDPHSNAVPCYVLDTVGASMCCDDTETCRPDGLCKGNPNGFTGPYDNGSAIWRRYCTDYTWQHPACLAIGPC